MPSRTRLNPTANGPLHVGHAYMALVNQAEAHFTGGLFTLRIEDNQDFWVWKVGVDATRLYCEGIVRDLEWLGIVPDRITLQSQTQAQVQEAVRFALRGRWFDPEHKFSFYAPEVHGMYDTVFYPYAPWLTIDKVMEDALDSINVLIRGVDLLAENAFYEHCCDLLGIGRPRMVYMPRLMMRGGGQLSPLSKTEGTGKIASYRGKGYKPGDVMELLRQACLVDPGGSWLIQNVKDKPLWIG